MIATSFNSRAEHQHASISAPGSDVTGQYALTAAALFRAHYIILGRAINKMPT